MTNNSRSAIQRPLADNLASSASRDSVTSTIKQVREIGQISIDDPFGVTQLASGEIEAACANIEWRWLERLAGSVIPLIKEILIDHEVSIDHPAAALIGSDAAAGTAVLRLLVRSEAPISDELWEKAQKHAGLLILRMSAGSNDQQEEMFEVQSIDTEYSELFNHCLNVALEDVGGTITPAKTTLIFGQLKLHVEGRLAPKSLPDRPDDSIVEFEGVLDGILRSKPQIIVICKKPLVLRLDFDANEDYCRIDEALRQPLSVTIPIRGTYRRTTDLLERRVCVLEKWELVTSDNFELM